jgi:hypothetical protein
MYTCAPRVACHAKAGNHVPVWGELFVVHFMQDDMQLADDAVMQQAAAAPAQAPAPAPAPAATPAQAPAPAALHNNLTTANDMANAIMNEVTALQCKEDLARVLTAARASADRVLSMLPGFGTLFDGYIRQRKWRVCL